MALRANFALFLASLGSNLARFARSFYKENMFSCIMIKNHCEHINYWRQVSLRAHRLRRWQRAPTIGALLAPIMRCMNDTSDYGLAARKNLY